MALQRHTDALRTPNQSQRPALAPAEARVGEAAAAQRKYLGSLGRGPAPGTGPAKAQAAPPAPVDLAPAVATGRCFVVGPTSATLRCWVSCQGQPIWAQNSSTTPFRMLR